MQKQILVAVLGCLFPVLAAASVPVNHKSEGCVIGGKVFSIYQGQVAYRYQLPGGYDLKPYEGKKVLLEGELAPGDSFTPKDKVLKALGPCNEASKKLIGKAR